MIQTNAYSIFQNLLVFCSTRHVAVSVKVRRALRIIPETAECLVKRDYKLCLFTEQGGLSSSGAVCRVLHRVCYDLLQAVQQHVYRSPVKQGLPPLKDVTLRSKFPDVHRMELIYILIVGHSEIPWGGGGFVVRNFGGFLWNITKYMSHFMSYVAY